MTKITLCKGAEIVRNDRIFAIKECKYINNLTILLNDAIIWSKFKNIGQKDIKSFIKMKRDAMQITQSGIYGN